MSESDSHLTLVKGKPALTLLALLLCVSCEATYQSDSSQDVSSSGTGNDNTSNTTGEEEGGLMYRYVFLPLQTESQTEAQARCHEIHGSLAVIRSADDVARVKRDTWETGATTFPDNNLITGNSGNSYSRFIWLGGSLDEGGMTWSWSFGAPGLNDSAPFYSRNTSSCLQSQCFWTPFYPIYQSTRQGVLLDKVTLEWISSPELSIFSSNILCQVPLDKYYKYVFVEGLNDAVSQNQANDICVDQGGFLATITGWSDMALLHQDIKLLSSSSSGKLDLPSNPWLGGSDDTSEGSWYWKYGPPTVRGKLFYDRPSRSCKQHACFWSTNEPNNYNVEHQMVFLGTKESDSTRTLMWNDVGSRHRASVLCQIPIYNRYYFTSVGITRVSRQSDAQLECEALGGNLPVLTSVADTLRFAKSVLFNQSSETTATPWEALPIATQFMLGGQYDGSSQLWTWKYGPPEFRDRAIFSEANSECYLGNISSVWEQEVQGSFLSSDFGVGTSDVAPALQQNGDSACLWKPSEPSSNTLTTGEALLLDSQFGWFGSKLTTNPSPSSSPLICQFLNTSALAWSEVPARRNISQTMLDSLGGFLNKTYQAISLRGENTTWSNIASSSKANLFCRAKGGVLASISSISEQNKAIAALVRSASQLKIHGIHRVASGGMGRFQRSEFSWRWLHSGIGVSGQVISSGGDTNTDVCEQNYCNWDNSSISISSGSGSVIMISTNTTGTKSIITSPRKYKYISLGISKAISSQSAADELCREKGGYLATVTSQTDMDSLKEDIDFNRLGTRWSPNGAVWLGGAEDGKVWKWKYGPPEVRGLSFWDEREESCLQSKCFWSSGEPNDYGSKGEDVMILYRDSLLWNDAHVDTYSTSNVLCQIAIPPTVNEQLGGRWESQALPTTPMDTHQNSTNNPFLAVLCQFENPYPERFFENGYFYKVVEFGSSALSAAAANQRCLDQYGYLAAITSQDDLDQLENDVGLSVSDKSKLANWPGGGAWLGGADSFDDGEWVWHYARPEVRGQRFYRDATTQCSQSKCFWASGEPNGRTNENFLMLYEKKTWNDSGSNKRAGLCQIPKNASSVPYFYRYTLFDLGAFSHRLKLLTSRTSVNAAAANDLCSQQGGYLATITSAQDLQDLTQDLAVAGQLKYDSRNPQVGTQIDTSKNVWIGGADDTKEGDWYWKYGPPEVRGSKFFSKTNRECLQDNCFFAINEPNDHSSGEDSLQLRIDFAWNDMRHVSATSPQFLCQIREWGVRSRPKEPIPAAGAKSVFHLQRYAGSNFSQHAADAMCRTRGSWLATLRSADEISEAANAIAAFKRSTSSTSSINVPNGYIMTAGSNWNASSGMGGELWSWLYGAYGRRGEAIFGPPSSLISNSSTARSPAKTHTCVKKKFTYIGSYKDTSNRALRYGPHAYGYTQQTCMEACAEYTYFALQNGGWCCCDNSFDHATKYGKLTSSCYPDGSGWCNALYSVESTTEIITTTSTCLQESCAWASTCAAVATGTASLVVAIDSNDKESSWVQERELLPAGEREDDATWYLCQAFTSYDGFVPSPGDGSGSFDGGEMPGSGGDGWWWWTAAPGDQKQRYRYQQIKTNRRLSQLQASKVCADSGGYLATITSQEDYNALVEDLGLNPSNPRLASDHSWIGGADDSKERMWYWKYGPPEVRGANFYDHGSRRCLQEKCFWASNEPNDYGRSGEDAMIIYKNLKWNDAHDSTYSRMNVICQMPTSGTIAPDSWRDSDHSGDSSSSSSSATGAVVAVVFGIIIIVSIICVVICCCARRNRRTNSSDNNNNVDPNAPARVWQPAQHHHVDTEMQPVEGTVVQVAGGASPSAYGYNASFTAPLGYSQQPPTRDEAEDRPFSELPPPDVNKQSKMGPPPSYTDAQHQEEYGGHQQEAETGVEIVDDVRHMGPSNSDYMYGFAGGSAVVSASHAQPSGGVRPTGVEIADPGHNQSSV